jgi:hypothetical protein
LDITNHPFLVPPSFSVQAHLSKLEPTSSEELPLGHWKVHTSLLVLEKPTIEILKGSVSSVKRFGSDLMLKVLARNFEILRVYTQLLS